MRDSGFMYCTRCELGFTLYLCFVLPLWATATFGLPPEIIQAGLHLLGHSFPFWISHYTKSHFSFYQYFLRDIQSKQKCWETVSNDEIQKTGQTTATTNVKLSLSLSKSSAVNGRFPQSSSPRQVGSRATRPHTTRGHSKYWPRSSSFSPSYPHHIIVGTSLAFFFFFFLATSPEITTGPWIWRDRPQHYLHPGFFPLRSTHTLGRPACITAIGRYYGRGWTIAFCSCAVVSWQNGFVGSIALCGTFLNINRGSCAVC